MIVSRIVIVSLTSVPPPSSLPGREVGFMGMIVKKSKSGREGIVVGVGFWG